MPDDERGSVQQRPAGSLRQKAGVGRAFAVFRTGRRRDPLVRAPERRSEHDEDTYFSLPPVLPAEGLQRVRKGFFPRAANEPGRRLES
ncbi:hypothetical protein GCM10009564_42900 [Streptomyces thermogriseus]|uniref:Uncharacterized protein n=1 Tax=Streptomyces thermogriseus TaxID=75292 RepID=A0ABN1T3J9_9ACTN